MGILGSRVVRREDARLLTTGGVYCEDLMADGALWATYVRSTIAHGRIAGIDTSVASRMPGVVAVYTAGEVDLPPLTSGLPGVPEEMSRPLLAGMVVRFVGEPVAVVLTEERQQGDDAAEFVNVDYEPLPAVVDVEKSLASEVVLFPEVGTNVAHDIPTSEDGALFDGCDVVVTQRVRNQRVAPCPLEVRSSLAAWGDDGRLTQWVSTQAPHGFRDAVAGLYGLDVSDVRVIAPDVGGGFGAKIGPYPEEVLLPWLAQRTGRPVRWTETRSESMVALGHGRGQVQEVTIGGDFLGRIHAYRLRVVQDAGAYPAIGAFLPFLTKMMASGTYDIPKVEFSAYAVVTNTTPVVAYRGAGRPEATGAIERAMDLFAAEIGADPAELRRQNLLPAGVFPHAAATGPAYDVGDYERALDLALAAARYDALRAAQSRRRSKRTPYQIGIGVSTYVEITNGAGDYGEFAALEVTANGTVVVYTGSSPHGQGHETAWAMIAAAQLGVPLAQVEVVANDTDLVASGVGTYGSRSLQAGGLAVHEASVLLSERAVILAAELLHAHPRDVVLDRTDGRFRVTGSLATCSWGEIANAAGHEGLRVEHTSSPPSATFPFGAHVAVVEVDVETGAVRLRRIVAVDDAGRILNPILAEGQRHGGLAQGVGQALLEEVRYDGAGIPVTSNLADYPLMSAAELPSFELVTMETPTPVNPLGAKGIGESGTIGSGPAVQNAVVDALSHLGVRHIDMPATPERVWQILREQRRK